MEPESFDQSKLETISRRKNLLGGMVFATLPILSLLVFGGAALSEASRPYRDLDENTKSGIQACSLSLLEEHNPGIVKSETSNATLVCFSKYVSDFDTRKMETPSGKTFAMGVPRWVIQRVDGIPDSPEGLEAYARPSAWFTVPDLASRSLAPTDDSYRFSQRFRQANGNWFERGHLAQKYLAERPPPDELVKLNPNLPEGAGSGWFTHNVANAVPQRARFNKGPWLTLECYTGAWANRYKRVWILSGPVFINARPTKWLQSDRNREALPVAIPDALFKVVLKQGDDRRWDALAFVYPQDAAEYRDKKVWNPANYLTSVDQVQRLTGIDVLPSITGAALLSPEQEIPKTVWHVDRKNFDPSCRRFAPELS